MLCKCHLMAAVLLFLNPCFMPKFTSAFVTLVKLNESATLRCNMSCPGVCQWKGNGKTVAECGPGAKKDLQFNCEINQIENILTVHSANFLNRGFYSAYCGEKEMGQCRQVLQLIPPEEDFELDVGDNLAVDLRVDDPVIVKFARCGNSSAVEVCRVDGRRRQCHPDYQLRVHIMENVLVLMDVKPSDSGNYSVREKDDTLISSSNARVKERSSRGKIPTSPARENRDPKHIFISRVNDLQESWVWKDGYWCGVKIALLAATIPLLVCIVFSFCLGIRFGPKVLPLLNRCSLNPGITGCLNEDQSEVREEGVHLTTNHSNGCNGSSQNTQV